MKDFSIQTRVYIIATLIAGFLFLAFFEFQWVWMQAWQKTWIQTILLAVLGALSLLFKVEGSTNRTHYNLTFILYGFSLILLGAPQTLMVIFVAHIVEWIWHKYPWYIQLFNLSSYIVVAVFTNVTYELLNPTRTLSTWESALSMLVAMSVFTLLNHLMVGIIVWFARGENFAKSGIFEFFSLMLDLVLLCLGAGLAVIWTFNPLAIVLIILSLYLIFATLRVPALERQAETDSKTGLYNHKYFMTCLETELSRAERFNRPLSVVMSDLDLLRNINNTYGHLAGDEVLIGVAHILKKFGREYDVVSRFGGEEFAILMPETSAEEAYPITQSIREAIAAENFMVPTSVSAIKATMSFGISEREGGLTGMDIIHNADMALYHAKLKGRNRVFIYSNDGFNELFQPERGPSPASSCPVADKENNLSAAPILTSNVEHKERAPEPLIEPDQPAGPAQTRRGGPAMNTKQWVNVYIYTLAIAALGLFSLTISAIPPVDLSAVGLFALLVAAAEWASIDIYVRNTSVSPSAVLFIAGVLLFGPMGAIVLGAVIAVVAFIKHKSPFTRFIFNASNQLFAGMVCYLLIRLTGSDFRDGSILFQIIASMLAGLTVYLFTSCFVAIGISMDFRVSFRQIWVEQFSWLPLYYVGMGLMAFTLVYSYLRAGIPGALVILVPLFLLRFSQKQYIDRTKNAVNELKEKNKMLEVHSSEITRLNNGLLDTLAEVIDFRDPYLLGHSRQVTQYALLIAKELGLNDSQIEIIRKASLMHDLGKLGIHTSLLSKSTGLTHEEYEVIKRHVTVGADLLHKSQALESLITIVLHHHEHFDGNGYPDGLKATDIPLEARIVCLADSIDAMASNRPYRKAMKFEMIMAEIRRCAGSQFDPSVVHAFEEIALRTGPSLIKYSAHNNINSSYEEIPVALDSSKRDFEV